jgi:hypothetical protein
LRPAARPRRLHTFRFPVRILAHPGVHFIYIHNNNAQRYTCLPCKILFCKNTLFPHTPNTHTPPQRALDAPSPFRASLSPPLPPFRARAVVFSFLITYTHTHTHSLLATTRAPRFISKQPSLEKTRFSRGVGSGLAFGLPLLSPSFFGPFLSATPRNEPLSPYTHTQLRLSLDPGF